MNQENGSLSTDSCLPQREGIEARSMNESKEVPSHSFDRRKAVVRRMIHTTGDFGLIDLVRFSPGDFHGTEALRQGGHLCGLQNDPVRTISESTPVFTKLTRPRVLSVMWTMKKFSEARQHRLPRSSSPFKRQNDPEQGL